MGREVITIQAGGFANHVAAHYWNIQVILLLTLASSYLANGDMGCCHMELVHRVQEEPEISMLKRVAG